RLQREEIAQVRDARVCWPRREIFSVRCDQDVVIALRLGTLAVARSVHLADDAHCCGRKRAVATLASSDKRVRCIVPMPAKKRSGSSLANASKPKVWCVRSGRNAYEASPCAPSNHSRDSNGACEPQ